MITISILLSYRNIYYKYIFINFYCVIDDRLVASRTEFLEITVVTVVYTKLPQKQIHQHLTITLRI